MTWSEERRAELQRLRDEGLSIGKAAKQLGVHRGSACWAAARYGIGREPADLSRAKPPVSYWDESRLTERWADRKRKAA